LAGRKATVEIYEILMVNIFPKTLKNSFIVVLADSRLEKPEILQMSPSKE
jgi:hypothetical protein